MSLGTVYRPALAYMGFGKQSVFGTAVAPIYFSRWNKLGPAEDQIKMGTYRSGYDRDLSIAAKMAQTHPIKYTGWMFSNSTSALLAYFLGGTDTVTGSEAPYEHVFSEANAETDLPYMSFEHSIATDQEVDQIRDGRIDEIKITAKAGELVTVDTSVKSTVTAAQSTLASVTFDTDRPASFLDGTITFATLTAASANITNITFDMKNGSNDVMTMGQVYPYFIMPGAREFSFTADVLTPNNDLYREILFGGSSNTTGSTAPMYETSLTLLFATDPSTTSIQIVATNIECEVAKPTFDSNAKPFTLQISGKVIKASESSSYITVTAYNSVSTAFN